MKRAQSGFMALLWAACLWLGCARAETFESEHAVITFVRTLAESCVGEGETVEAVVLENGVLSVRVDLSGGKAPTTVTLEDVARDRAGGISDAILSHPELDAHWEAIRIFVAPVFAAEYTKDVIVSQDWGRYFKSGKRLEMDKPDAAQATPTSTPTPASTSTPTPVPSASAPFTPIPTAPTPTPAVTAAPPTPGHAAASTAPPIVHGVVNMNHVNLREGAGLEHRKIDTLHTGVPLILLGQERTLEGELWYIVRYGDTRGFVRADLVDVAETAQPAPQAPPQSVASAPISTAYADLSDEALRQMLYGLLQEARARQQESALELPMGTYGVGTQIPPGEYTLSTQADLCVVELYDSPDSNAQDRYLQGYSLSASDAVGRIVLREGMSFVVALGSATLQTFFTAGETQGLP